MPNNAQRPSLKHPSMENNKMQQHTKTLVASLALIFPVLPGVSLNAFAAPVGYPVSPELQGPIPGSISQTPPSVYKDERGGTNYSLNAQVSEVQVSVDCNDIVADGQTPVKITVRVLDRQGQPLKGESYLTVETTGGRIQLLQARTDELGPGLRDIDKVTQGTQVKVIDGIAEFNLIAPHVPQDVRVRVTAGRSVAEGSISFLPELREMLAIGLIEGVLSAKRVNESSIVPARINDGFERDIQRWERSFNNGKSSVGLRSAFFVKGKVKGEYLLTAAYDSDKDTRQRLLRDVRPDEFYPVYGDASIKGFDARSRDRLYVRVDHNKTYVLYGDFATGDGFSQITGAGQVAPLRLRDLGNYNRTVTGGRYHYEQNGAVANFFATHDTLKQVVEEFAGKGISGPYSLSNNSGIQNSEKVEMIVRDRNAPARILSVTPLLPLTDYTFEPFSGRILFNRPIPTVDQNLNPVSVRISYEVDQSGPSFWLFGADGQVKLNERLEVGGSAVRDRNPFAPYELSSANIGVRLGEKTMLVAEMARTVSTAYSSNGNSYSLPVSGQSVADGVERSGNAGRIELRHQDEKLDARGYIARTDATFNNAGASFTGGRSEAGIKATAPVSDTIKVYGEAIKTEDRTTGADRKGAQVGALYQATEKLTLDVAVKRVNESAGLSSTALVPTPTTAPLGQGLQPNGGLFGNGVDAINPTTGTAILSPTSNASVGTANLKPLDATTLKLGALYQATDKLGLKGEVEHDISGEDKKRIAAGADYLIAERTKLYGRYETQSGLASIYSLNPADKSTAFVFGVDNTYAPGQQLYSEYRLRDAISSNDMYWANGLRNTFNVAEGVRYQTGLEYLKVLSGSGQAALAATVGLDYTANPLWKASGRLEARHVYDSPTVAGSDSYLSTLTYARKMSRDWTFLTRNYLLYTDYRGGRGDALQDRYQIGAAYRDTDTNKVNALMRYEYKYERDDSGLQQGTAIQTTPSHRRVHLLSSHADYHPTRPWWLTGRLAAKWVNDPLDNVNSRYSAWLVSGRAVYDITERWDLGVMTSYMGSPYGSSKQWAQGFEVGYLIRQNLWLSAGFNWTGFSDRDLTGTDYTQRGAYLRLRFKFDEDLLERKSEMVNRSLDRSVDSTAVAIPSK